MSGLLFIGSPAGRTRGRPPAVEGTVLNATGQPAAHVRVFSRRMACDRRTARSRSSRPQRPTPLAGSGSTPRPPRASRSSPRAPSGRSARSGPRDLGLATSWEGGDRGPPGRRFPWPVRAVDRQGRPVAGILLAPISASVKRGRSAKSAQVPDDLARLIAATTTPRGGRGSLHGAPRPAPRGPRDVARIGPRSWTWRSMRKMSRGSSSEGRDAAGRVARADGGPVEGLEVSLQAQTGTVRLPQPIAPPGGPIRVKADGTFRTPDASWRASAAASRSAGPGLSREVRRWWTRPGPARRSNGRS